MRARWDPGEGHDPDSSGIGLHPDSFSTLHRRNPADLAARGRIRRIAESRALVPLIVILALGLLVGAFIATDPVMSYRLQMKVQRLWTKFCH